MYHMHLLGRVDLKKKSVKSTRVPKMGALTEDRTESGTEAKALLCATRSPVGRHILSRQRVITYSAYSV